MLPKEFITSIENNEGFDRAAFIAVHQSAEQVTSVRLNLFKLQIQNPKFKTETVVPWSTNGYYLSERPSFTLDPCFHAGAYYVQEASSMFLEQALKQTLDLSKPLKILDLCAAPGGKSTLLQSLISSESLLVSNEVIKSRVTVLAENCTKWGADNIIVTNNDPQHFQRLENYFDVIVVDAPCSGSGLFRKDPNAINEWSENNVQLCSQRQQRILADVMPALKDGGVLIYSTCSYSKEEDEVIADWMMEELQVESCRLEVEESWGIVETVSEKKVAFGYRFYPDKLKGEGFFICAFRKNNSSGTTAIWPNQKNRKDQLPSKEADFLRSFLKTPDKFGFVLQKDEVIALPLYIEKELPLLQAALYIKKAGIKMGSLIRDELIPDHELAMYTEINPGIPFITVDEPTALSYLRREEFKLETELKGWVLLQCKGLNLGWIKILPNRINNYYPKDWRILKK